jgi:hypothetical protein
MPNILSALGDVLARAGRRDRARHAQELTAPRRRAGYRRAVSQIVHLGLGEHAEALSYLELAPSDARCR